MALNSSYLINGSLNQSISPFDRGFAYGDGVFRTMVMRNGLPDFWHMHYQKLVADCGAIGIVCPSAELLMSDLQQLFSVDEIAVAKIIVTRGEGNRGYTPPAITAPTRVVIKTSMPDYPEEYFSAGVHLCICDTRLANQAKLAGVKHLNRLENVLARMEWQDANIANGIVEGILLDNEANVIECTSANIFARFGDTLMTPALTQCGIAGITRQRILDIAHTLSLKPIIEVFNLNKLYQADEMIVCSSLYGAWQVQSIQDLTSVIQKSWSVGSLAVNIRAALKHDSHF
jgi:4-amino-4-deoxychorismate lyase